MKVSVDLASARLRLTEPRDFGRFHVEALGAAESPTNRQRLAAVIASGAAGRLDDEGARIRPEWLRAAGPATDTEWVEDLAGMLAYADKHGWIAEDGSVSAHVVWADEAAPLSEAHYRHVLGHFPSGVSVVTAMTPDGPIGFTCQSFSAVSIDPPLILICPGSSSTTWPRIRSADTFAVNVLAADQAHLCRQFAAASADRFSGVDWHPGPSGGAPLLEGSLSWLESRIEAEHPAGDHTVVLARVVAMDATDRDALIYFRGRMATSTCATASPAPVPG